MKAILVQLAGLGMMLIAYFCDNKDPLGMIAGSIWIVGGFIMEEIRERVR